MIIILFGQDLFLGLDVRSRDKFIPAVVHKCFHRIGRNLQVELEGEHPLIVDESLIGKCL